MRTIPFDTEEKYIENIALLKKIVENQDVQIIGVKTEYIEFERTEIAPLLDRIVKLRAPFEERLAVSISERDRNARKLYELPKQLDAFRDSEMLKAARAAGKFTEESFTAFIRCYEINESLHPVVKFKKALSNGIDVFRASDEVGTRLFFFKGTALVGFWTKRTPRHRGDETHSRAWWGVTFLRSGDFGQSRNDIETLEAVRKGISHYDGFVKHTFYRKTTNSRRIDPTMEQFMDYVVKSGEPALKIGMDDMLTLRILGKRINI